LIKYDQEGLIECNGNIYQGVQYDDTAIPLEKWLSTEKDNGRIEKIDIYRLIKSGLKTF